MAYYITHLLYSVCDEQIAFNMLYNNHLSILHDIIGKPTLPPAPLQCLRCPSSSIPCTFLAPLLSLRHSDMAWLTPAIAPHPDVELVQPTSVASPLAGIGHSSMAVFAKTMGHGGRPVSSHKARHHWHTTQHVLSPTQVWAG